MCVVSYCKELPALAVGLKSLMPLRKGKLRLGFAKKLAKTLDGHKMKEALCFYVCVSFVLCVSMFVCL